MVPELLGVTDVVGTDPYPVGNTFQPHLQMVSEWASASVKAAENKKGVWQVVQVFNKVAFQGKLSEDFADPTEEQIQNMLYRSIIEGAKGILFYAYHPLWYGINAEGKAEFSEEIYNQRWKEVSAVSREFAGIIPIILANDVTDVPNLKVDERVIHKAWIYKGETYLMVVNTSDTEALVVTPGQTIKLKGHGSQLIKL